MGRRVVFIHQLVIVLKQGESVFDSHSLFIDSLKTRVDFILIESFPVKVEVNPDYCQTGA
jgi:hypothetical protein